MPPTAPSTDLDSTKDRILTAAEELFSDHGFEGVSTRQLTQKAGVNLAAVNYHFGSKDALIRAIVGRHIVTINHQRLERLDTLEAAPTPPNSAEILRAFFLPIVHAAEQKDKSGERFLRLLGRCFSESDYLIPDAAIPDLAHMISRFTTALRNAHPHLDEATATRRLHFAMGVLIQTLLHEEAFQTVTQGRGGSESPETRIEHLVQFCSYGLNAPTLDS